MTKDALRTLYLQKRLALSHALYGQLNFQLYQHFFTGIDLSFVKILHTFLPLEKNKEPDTWLILDRIRREYPHIRVSVPRVNSETGLLENFFFEGLHQLENNRWGIPEPKQGVPTAPEKIDMVLVPMLIFDQAGQRVGYGKGFYDKFLKQCHASCVTVGLSLFDPVDAIEDTNDLDVPLRYCVTPSAVYRF